MNRSNRRAFLKMAGITATALPASALASKPLSAGGIFQPRAEADLAAAKPGLTLLGDRPINMETPPHLLDDAVTPANRLFVRNNGLLPDYDDAPSLANWRLTIDGAVERPLSLSLDDLKQNFEPVTRRLVLECGGNGRRFFSPAATGNQWTFGAVGCPEWTGVRLRDVLNAAGVKPSAQYTGHYGADLHLSGDPEKETISRGIPITKALEEDSLIAWGMNGEDLPPLHGYPLRLVVPGWPGSCSQKWLTRIWVRDQVHDGAKMGGKSYRVPAYPVAPGTAVPDEDMQIIEGMPVKSLITFPQTGSRLEAGAALAVRGHAWAGGGSGGGAGSGAGGGAVRAVDLSLDFGATWTPANLASPVNRYAWQQWSATLPAPAKPGYYEVWARATDENGVSQPATPPGWNPKGYLNNMQHRIAVFAL